MMELYRPLTFGGSPIFVMDRKSAELSKYACNSMLATRISFMNQFANLAEKIGADIEQVRKVMRTDPRIGKKFLYPGIGYGGSCFPKDVRGIINTSKQYGETLTILEEVDKANNKQKLVLVEKILNYYKEIKGKKIAVWGLAFKKNTNDMRESPSIPIIQELIKKGANITAYDPVAIEEAKHYFKNINYAKSKEEALKGNECLLILTDWDEFKQPDYSNLKEIKIIFDGKNFLEPSEIRKHKIKYVGIGRK
jgi:UDPglucose 6-dehydrogenase